MDARKSANRPWSMAYGPAGEAVQRVHGAASFDRQQPGGEEVGPAVPGVELPAPGVGVAQVGSGDPGGIQFTAAHRLCPSRTGGRRRAAVVRARPVMRAAASLPLSRTVGTPTPGVVPHPARTTLS